MWMVCGKLLDLQSRGIERHSLGELWDMVIEGQLYEAGDQGQRVPVGPARRLSYTLLRTEPAARWGTPRGGIMWRAWTIAGVGAPDESDRSDPACPWDAPGIEGMIVGDTVAAVALSFPETGEVALLGATASAGRHDEVLHRLLRWAERAYQLRGECAGGASASPRRRAVMPAAYARAA